MPVVAQIREKRIRRALGAEDDWVARAALVSSAIVAQTLTWPWANNRTWWALPGYFASFMVLFTSLTVVRTFARIRAKVALVKAQKRLEDQISEFEASQLERSPLDALLELPSLSPQMLALGNVRANYGDLTDPTNTSTSSSLKDLPSLESVRRLSDAR